MLTIKQYLERCGYTTASDETYSHISEWEDWYSGFVKGFHVYTVYNGVTNSTQQRARLNMAKTVCEDWANLLMNEKVMIHTGSSFDDVIKHVFGYNNFRVKSNQLLELAFAFGTGAFVEYLDSAREVVIDYIRAGMIYPLSWENGYINECAFGSIRDGVDGQTIYLQLHLFDKDKQTYYIENRIVDAESGKELSLPENMEATVNTGSTLPLFQIVTPNIVNNIDIDSPLGISVFGNAISQLKGCDLIYDSYLNEFAMGRRRILVPLSMAKIKMQDDGLSRPVFDPHDTTFYAVPDDRTSTQKIEGMDMSIRANEHELGITRALDMLSFKCGMGTGRYRFESGGVKTATEVVSEKSDLYQSLKKHELVLGEALEGLVRAIATLTGAAIPEEINIDFDDSIIEDKQSERSTDKGDIAIGVMRLEEYRAKWYGETLEDAAKNLPVPVEMYEPVGE